MKANNIAGMIFGRLTVLELDPVKGPKGRSFYCRCSCGKETLVRSEKLKSGHTRSCGCLRAAPRKVVAFSKTREYWAWKSMHARCSRPSHDEYHNYGARGISVCPRWSKFEVFISDMGPKPSKDHTVDRINNNGNYEPSNCRWATRKEQARNTRVNRLFTINGVTKTMIEWSETTGVNYNTIVCRLRSGWTVESAINTPVG